jgi:ATP-dependent RNA helicase DDX51/DBP6
LKRKRERRKLNKKAKPASTKQSLSKDDLDTSPDSEEEDVDEEVERVSSETKQKFLTDPVQSSSEPQSSPEPPRKRRKLSAQPEDVQVEVSQDEVEEEEHPSGSPVLEAPLPSFPLPALPDAPSRSTLALQGLDRGLVDADIIGPSTVLPIPLEGDSDGGTRLSEKMRRRLHDLGITELFAGKLFFLYSCFATQH